jgi:hypothetical protein
MAFAPDPMSGRGFLRPAEVSDFSLQKTFSKHLKSATTLHESRIQLPDRGTADCICSPQQAIRNLVRFSDQADSTATTEARRFANDKK